MNRAFGAIVRREIRRGRSGIAVYSGIAIVCMVLAAVLQSSDATLIPSVFAMICAFLVPFSPLGDLRTDKTLGHTEHDRVLPIGHRRIALARLIGAALRTVPMLLLLLPMVISLSGGDDPTLHRFVGAMLALIFWVIAVVGLWMLMAVNLRWNLRRLWWLPMTIAFGPRILQSVLPQRLKIQLADELRILANQGLHLFDKPAGLIAIAAITMLIPALVLWATIELFASGLDRYTYDIAAGTPIQGPAPKRELAAIGKGPVLAVTRYCIRLATEQSRRRLLLLLVFAVLLVVGNTAIKGYARFYVRALAALIPGSVVLQLASARTRGDLEGLQQLPHPASSIGLGHLLAIVVLAVPGTLVWALARAVNGIAPTFGNTFSLFGWLVMWTWMTAVFTLWLTRRRALMMASVPLTLLVVWAIYAGKTGMLQQLNSLGSQFGHLGRSTGSLLPALLVIPAMIVGLPMFARGLAEYQFSGRGSRKRRR